VSFPSSSFDATVHRCAAVLSVPAESLVEPADAGKMRAALALTDPIERHRSGDLPLVPPEDDYVGDYREYVLTPFAHPIPSRFSDGSYGVLYTAGNLDTALAETIFWLHKIYAELPPPADTRPRKIYLTMRLCTDLADLRRLSNLESVPDVYDPNDYTISQQFGSQLRNDGYPGVWYDSVRRSRGECNAAFIPRVISDMRPQYELEFTWDGCRFVDYKPVYTL
jgi:RES domain